MVLFNYAIREITAKIVYYGPGLGGKTTNLQKIHASLDPKSRGKLISLATDADRTLFFDFLPLDLGRIGGYRLRFQLYTVPGQVHYNATRKLVLKGVDAVVFVADSQIEMLDRNRESYDNLRENLAENGYEFKNIPIVYQFNKQDLPNVATAREVASSMSLVLDDIVWFEAVAIKGRGIFETLKSIIKAGMTKLRGQFEDTQSFGDAGKVPVGFDRTAAVGGEPAPAEPPPLALMEVGEPQPAEPASPPVAAPLGPDAIFTLPMEEPPARPAPAKADRGRRDMSEVDLEALLSEEVPSIEPRREILSLAQEECASGESSVPAETATALPEPETEMEAPMTAFPAGEYAAWDDGMEPAAVMEEESPSVEEIDLMPAGDEAERSLPFKLTAADIEEVPVPEAAAAERPAEVFEAVDFQSIASTKPAAEEDIRSAEEAEPVVIETAAGPEGATLWQVMRETAAARRGIEAVEFELRQLRAAMKENNELLNKVIDIALSRRMDRPDATADGTYAESAEHPRIGFWRRLFGGGGKENGLSEGGS